MLIGNRRAQLDGQVGDATGRVEHAGIDERSCRTRIQAAGARAALLEPFGVGLEVERADDLAEEQPRPELRVDQAGVLANPPEPRVLRVDPFLHRPGVDVGPRLEGLVRFGSHPGEQPVEPFLQDIVVVVAPGVPGQSRDAARRLIRVGTIGVVERAGDDDAACAGNDATDVGAPIGGSRHPTHLARVAPVDPLAKERQLREAVGPGDAAQVETQRSRLRFEERRTHRPGCLDRLNC